MSNLKTAQNQNETTIREMPVNTTGEKSEQCQCKVGEPIFDGESGLLLPKSVPVFCGDCNRQLQGF